MKCDAHIAAGKLASSFEGMGVPVSEDALSALTLEGKASFARNSNKYDTALAEDTAFHHPNHIDSIASGALQKLFGGKLGSWLTLPKDPGVILSEEFIQPLTDALQAHIESGGTAGTFRSEVVPVVRMLKNEIQNHFTDHGQINFANRYLSAWENGGSLYKSDKAGGILDIAAYPANTIAKNLVSNNPFITVANVFEFMPKALGVYGPISTARGMLDYVTAGGLKGRIPELEARGVYGTTSGGMHKGFDLINLTETPLRGLAYNVAKAAGKDGLEGVEKIAFKYRPGREPLILLDHGSAMTVTLMRFSIESAKMYGQWYKDIATGLAKGDVGQAGSAALGLALFHYMTALQTGAASSVPAPLWGLMNDEQKQAVQDLDDAMGLNLLKRTTGVEFQPSRMQPAGGVTLGLGFDLANTAITQGYKKAKEGSSALQEGDYTVAGVDFAKALLSTGQAFIPGVNTSVKKIGDIIGDTLTGKIQPEEVPAQLGKKLVGLQVGE